MAEMKLDCLLCLGGNGTHKTANLLSEEGLNIIGLPKTIDNDIFGTDVTFGFHSAMEIATEAIDRVHTTAGSHSRCMWWSSWATRPAGSPLRGHRRRGGHHPHSRAPLLH